MPRAVRIDATKEHERDALDVVKLLERASRVGYTRDLIETFREAAALDDCGALNVMGMDPMELLVVPRLIGLIITLPLLTFFSDVMGLLGGALISETLLDVSALQYVERVRQAVSDSDLFVGLFKAPIFGFLIAVIGCMHGLRVRGSADSVGRETTRAVVKAIFVVIVLDALFSVFFEKLGL